MKILFICLFIIIPVISISQNKVPLPKELRNGYNNDKIESEDKAWQEYKVLQLEYNELKEENNRNVETLLKALTRLRDYRNTYIGDNITLTYDYRDAQGTLITDQPLGGSDSNQAPSASVIEIIKVSVKSFADDERTLFVELKLDKKSICSAQSCLLVQGLGSVKLHVKSLLIKDHMYTIEVRDSEYPFCTKSFLVK